MATGIYSWSQTAASNNTADSTINWSEGQAPSTVNDSARAEMAVLAKWRDDMSGVQPSNVVQTTAGSANAQTLTTNGSIAALTNGWTLTFKVGSSLANTAACTLAVDSLTAKNIQTISGTSLVGGELYPGCVYTVTYHQPADAWVVHGGLFPSEVLLTSGSMSGANTSVDLSSYTSFRAIKFVLTSVIPVSASVGLQAQVAIAGVYQTAGSDYDWVYVWGNENDATPVNNKDSADSAIEMTDVVSTTHGCNVTATLFNQTSTSVWKMLRFDSEYWDTSNDLNTVRGAGSFVTSTSAINGVRFLFESGNISSGFYAVYGLR